MWRTVKLGEVCELAYGRALDKSERLDSDGVPAFGANGIKTYAKKSLFNEPSIIVGRKGSAGEITKVDEPFWALDVTYYVKIDRDIIDLNFLFYTLTTLNLPSMARGVKPGINRNDVYEKRILLPTLAEQQRIVAKLDAAFAEIDEALASTTKKTKQLETLSVQSINEIITKNCTEIITKPLQALFKLSSGKFLPKNEMQGDGNVKVYGGNGIAGIHNIANLEGQNVVIGRVGAKCGNVHFVDERIWLTDNAMYVHSLKNEFNLEFLTTILASLNLGSYARQSAQPVISFSSIKDVEVSFPISLEEQNKVVEELHKFKTSFDELVDIYRYKSKQLDALKSAILAQELQSEAA